jgi:RNA polymerase sigma-70 factor (ECF subfamily)
MTRATRLAPEGVPSGAGLRALAEAVVAMINDLGLGLGTRLCPQISGGPVGPLLATATSTSAGRRSHSLGRRARPDPIPPAAPEPGPGDEASDASADLQDEHAEMWRLVTAAQAGDGEAFGQLYDRYVDTVFRFIYFRVNDRALAEDFTSETFLRALRRIGSISYQGRDIGAWFVTIARNIILDHLKSARNRLEVTTADTVEGDQREPSPETAVLELLTNERLMAAVNRLGDEQRECVMLRFIQGFSVAETAAVMGKNDGAIKALQHRAVRKLAELVGDELR